MKRKGADGVRNDTSKLPGGSSPIKESADCLIRRGLKKELVIEAISGNPEKYVQKIQ
jgi:hypothetical protein